MLRLQLLPADDIEAPAGLRTVRVSRGHTLGGVYVARYSEGSTVRYHELIVFSALVRKGARPGFSVSDIYVDDPLAAVGGREIWGLPKRLATFLWEVDGGGRTIAVADGTLTLCGMRVPEARRSAKLPIGHADGDITTHYSAAEIAELRQAAQRIVNRRVAQGPALMIVRRTRTGVG